MASSLAYECEKDVKSTFITFLTFVSGTSRKVIPFKNVNHEVVIKIGKDNLIHRFGIPQIITADQGTVFTGDQVKEFAKTYGFF